MITITNLAAQRAGFYLNQVSLDLSRVLDQTSSGLRVPSASYDPAGIAIATNLSTQEGSQRQAIRNANDGISMMQVGEGASAEVTDMLQRMRELAVQSSSGTISDTDRATLETEFDELQSEIDRIAADSEFNDINLTDGTTTSLSVQVGTANSSNSRITMSFGDLTASTLGVSSSTVSSQSGAQSAITAIDTALDTVNGYSADYGATTTRMDSAIDFGSRYIDSLTSARSSIMDVDAALAFTQQTKLQLLQESAVAAMVQAHGMNKLIVEALI